LTRDGVPVLLHDATLDRTTDARGPLAERTRAELAAIDAGGWFDAAFRGTRIPSLEEVLDRIGDRARAIIELKVDRPGETGLRNAVLAMLGARPDPARHVFTSMDWDLLDGAKDRVPDLDVALTVRRLEPRDAIAAAARTGASAIHPHRSRVGRRLVARAHAEGLAVRPYTVNDARQLTPLVRAGVDAVFTDDPARLLACVGGGACR
jgi:glycerophosphoryl diester phosphodiesterase